MRTHPRLFEEDAKSKFGQLEARARLCVARAEEAWNRACAAEPMLRVAARGRGRNSIFSELVAEFAREIFDGDADVDIHEQYGTVRLHVGDEYDIGFKKIDGNGRTSNYPTNRQQMIEEQLPLFGEPLPDAARLTIGIEWNRAGTEVIDVYMIYPYRRSVLWRYPCRDGGGDVSGSPVVLPTPEAPPAPAKFRSKSRTDRKRKDGAGEA